MMSTCKGKNFYAEIHNDNEDDVASTNISSLLLVVEIDVDELSRMEDMILSACNSKQNFGFALSFPRLFAMIAASAKILIGK